MLHFNLRVSQAPKVKIVAQVSKKVAKKAVTRNKIKRRIRAATVEIAKKIKPALYIVSAKAGSDTLLYSDLKLELAELFKRS